MGLRRQSYLRPTRSPRAQKRENAATCALMRAMRVIVLALVLLVAPAAAAADTAGSEITVDLDAVSVAVTYARRAGPRVLLGGGGGVGPSPFLGTIGGTNCHYEPAPNI